MNDLPEASSNNANNLETLDYLREVKSSTCLLLPMTPSPTQLDLKHPLSEEMTEGPFLTLSDDQKMEIKNSGKYLSIIILTVFYCILLFIYILKLFKLTPVEEILVHRQIQTPLFKILLAHNLLII